MIEKIKNYLVLILGIIILVLGIFLWIFYKDYVSEKENRKRIENNYNILQNTDKSKQQKLTVDEFKQYYKKFDSIASDLDIRSKEIRTIIQNKYNFRDTTLEHHLTVIDSIKTHTVKSFDISKSCYRLKGSVDYSNDKINTDLTVEDKIVTFIYGKRVKKFTNLWGVLPWGKIDISAKTYS